MNKIEYKAAASAYRKNIRDGYGIAMAYHHRPANADHLAELERYRRGIAALPAAPKPPGFDKAPVVEFGVGLSGSRRRLLIERRRIREELVRRATEAIEYRLMNLEPPIYCNSSVAMAKAAAALQEDHLAAIQ